MGRRASTQRNASQPQQQPQQQRAPQQQQQRAPLTTGDEQRAVQYVAVPSDMLVKATVVLCAAGRYAIADAMLLVCDAMAATTPGSSSSASQLASYQLLHAAALLGLSRFGPCVACCSRALALVPDSEVALCRRATALALDGKLSQAAEDLRRCVALDPSNVVYRHNLAVVERAATGGGASGSAGDISQRIVRDFRDVDASHAEALRYWCAVWALDSASRSRLAGAPPRFGYSSARVASGGGGMPPLVPFDVRVQLAHDVSRPADTAQMGRENGNRSFQARRYEDAVMEYSVAVALQPTQAVHLSNRAAALLHCGRFLDAVVDCTASVALAPSLKPFFRRGLGWKHMYWMGPSIVDLDAALSRAAASASSGAAGPTTGDAGRTAAALAASVAPAATAASGTGAAAAVAEQFVQQCRDCLEKAATSALALGALRAEQESPGGVAFAWCARAESAPLTSMPAGVTLGERVLYCVAPYVTSPHSLLSIRAVSKLSLRIAYWRIRALDFGERLVDRTSLQTSSVTRLVKTLERVSFHWMSSVSDSALRIVNCNGLREVVLAASEPEVVAWGARPAWPPIRHVTDRGLAFLARAGATLRKLSLHACVQVTSRGLQAVLRAAPALESLELSNSVAFDLQCARTLVASCAALDTLRLTKSPSTNARALAPLAELPRLRVVRLESVGAVGDAGLAALGACASLEVLECSCPAVTDAGVASFCAAQQRAHGDGGTPPLRVLELSRARLLSCASLEHAASTLRALQELRVPAANRITGVPASVLGARLACLDVAGATLLDTQSVRSLLLTGAALGAQLTELHVIGATTVSPSVLGAALRSPRAGRLRVLSVPCVDASGAPLALHSLERLRMGELVGASATSLANVCSGAPVLRELFIDDCSAAHDEHIVRAARHLHNLVALTLRNAPAVSDSALSVLLAGLGGLLHLDVRRFARMTDTTCSIVAVSCTRLRSLCIKHCQLVTDVGITAICSPPAVLLTLRIGHCPLVHERVVYSLVAQLQHHCSVQLAGAGPLGAATTLSAALPVLSTAGASAAAESLAPANGKHAVAVARA